MDIIGVVCEYNPMHLGHVYHLENTRRLCEGDNAIVCVMSGDFVQRGENAAFSKFARAEAAVRSGADAVIELPLPWSLASAEGFARGSVGLLDAMGAKYLSFGTEDGGLSRIEKLAETLIDPGCINRIRERMSEDGTLSFAAAREAVLFEMLGEDARAIRTPNNILAVEYIKAIYDNRYEITPLSVKRTGNGHDSTGDGIKSASEIRAIMHMGGDISKFIPPDANGVYRRDIEQGRGTPNEFILEAAILSRLRMLGPEEFEGLPDGADGAGARLFAAAKEPTLEAVTAAAKTRRYTLSRIRRMALCAALGVRAGMAEGIPPYARVLAVNEKGREALREIKKTSGIPILTKPASVKALGPEAGRIFSLTAQAHDLYALGYRAEQERQGGMDWRTGPKII